MSLLFGQINRSEMGGFFMSKCYEIGVFITPFREMVLKVRGGGRIWEKKPIFNDI